MPSYVVLLNWTDNGITNFGHTLQGYRSAQEVMQESGARFKDIYWTVGQHDLVGIVEAPDDETATAAMLSISSMGGVRATVLRAFTADEIGGVLEKATAMAAALAEAELLPLEETSREDRHGYTAK